MKFNNFGQFELDIRNIQRKVLCARVRREMKLKLKLETDEVKNKMAEKISLIRGWDKTFLNRLI